MGIEPLDASLGTRKTPPTEPSKIPDPTIDCALFAESSEQVVPQSKTKQPKLGKIGEIYKKDGALVLHSATAGAVSFPASWLVSAMSSGALSTPLSNAAIGMATSVAVYMAVFFALNLWRSRNELKTGTGEIAWHKVINKFTSCLRILGLKELTEMVVRFGIHAGLMSAGLSALMASPIAQIVAGGVGHLATPIFANLGRKDTE